jgi:hypothetical protein
MTRSRTFPPVQGAVAHTTQAPLKVGDLADLTGATAELFRLGVPVYAAVAVEDRLGGLVLTARWEAIPPPEVPPSRGVLLARRLRSGTLALVRLRRG